MYLRLTAIFGLFLLLLNLSHAHTENLWTIFVYVAGDIEEGQIENRINENIAEIKKSGSHPLVKIVMQRDFYTTQHTRGVSFKTGRYVYTGKRFDLCQIFPEMDTTDPTTLLDFLNWGRNRSPAERYGLIFYGHGKAWEGIGFDSSGRHKYLSLQDFSENVCRPFGEKFAFILFDACLMGSIEVAYELKDCADYLVVSQDRELAAGHYYAFLEKVHQSPQAHTSEVVKKMVKDYVVSYAPEGEQSDGLAKRAVTAVAVDQGKISDFADHVASYVQALEFEGAPGRYSHEQFDYVRDGIEHGQTDLPYLVDLYTLFRGVYEEKRNIFPELVKRKAQAVLDAYGYTRYGEYGYDPTKKVETIKRKRPGILVWGFENWTLGAFPSIENLASAQQLFGERFGNKPDGFLMIDSVVKSGGYWPYKRLAADGEFYETEIHPWSAGILRWDYFVIDNLESKKLLGALHSEERAKGYYFTSHFPEGSPLVAEGHTQGSAYAQKNNWHGLAIFNGTRERADHHYKSLAFEQRTQWAQSFK